MDTNAFEKSLSWVCEGSHVQAGAPTTPHHARTWACGSSLPRGGRGGGREDVDTIIKGLSLKSGKSPVDYPGM